MRRTCGSESSAAIAGASPSNVASTTFSPARSSSTSPCQHDLALVHDRDMVGRALDLTDLMRAEQDRRAACRRVDHQIEHVALMHRIQPARRLVEHEDVGPGGERHRQRERALLALGQLLHLLLDVEGEEVQQRLRSRRVVPAKRPLGQLKMVAAGHPTVERVALRHVRDAFEQLGPQRLAVEAHRAGVWKRQTQHALEGRRLAGAVRAEQAEDRPFVDRE